MDISRRQILLTAAAVSIGGAAQPVSARLLQDPAPHPAMNPSQPYGKLPPNHGLALWYTKPASQWVEALPIGSGRLGGMVFGGITSEQIQINEDTLWAGGPYDPNNSEALANLPEIRRLIFAGECTKATAVIDGHFMAKPLRQMSYQTVGDLFLTFPATSTDIPANYYRDLDIDRAVATVTYSIGDTTYTREYFASFPAQLLIIRLTASKPGQISFSASLKSPQKEISIAATSDDNTALLTLSGKNTESERIPAKLTFETQVQIIPAGGTLATTDTMVSVSNADSVELRLAAATSFVKYDDVSANPSDRCKNYLAQSKGLTYDALIAAHIADHQKLFHRVSLDLGTSPAAKLPTDERIQLSSSSNDPALASLYFQYARYLLIASSRPGTQPANLQGLWNDLVKPPWGSKYTININTEMNYWPAEPTGLSECVDPLIQLVKDLSVRGQETAKVHYGAKGWVCHHNTDIWRATAPIDKGFYGTWPTGGAWLSLHLWDHYQYSLDKAFLAEAYPILKGAAEFFLTAMIEDPHSKYLVTCPSMSPENQHPNGTSICAGPMMDTQIIRDLFTAVISSSELLAQDESFREQVIAAKARLVPNKIGSAGQLQEWQEDWDMGAKDMRHRHVSHLYGLFPSGQIDPRTTPDLAAAAQKSLEIRGDKTTGWAIAWRINLWARLLNGDRTHSILKLLLEPDRTYPNMFDAHPPFQIDGNFGGCSGIVEMLLQSHNGEIHLLPALPSAWPTGKITGLRARGGFIVDLAWSDHKLTQATIYSAPGTTGNVRYANQTRAFTVKPRQPATLTATL